jgi:hypothetical protein
MSLSLLRDQRDSDEEFHAPFSDPGMVVSDVDASSGVAAYVTRERKGIVSFTRISDGTR